jgi:hypothetical protein
MSAINYTMYTAVGLLLVGLSLWRIARDVNRSDIHSGAASAFKPAGLVIGIVILVVIAASLLGIVSLDGVDACLKENVGHRSRVV